MRRRVLPVLVMVLVLGVDGTAYAQADGDDDVLEKVGAAIGIAPIAFLGLWIATWPVDGFWSDDVVEDNPVALTLSGVGAAGLAALAAWRADGEGRGLAIGIGIASAYAAAFFSSVIWAAESALGSDPRGCSSPLCKKLVLAGSVLLPLAAGLITSFAIEEQGP